MNFPDSPEGFYQAFLSLYRYLIIMKKTLLLMHILGLSAFASANAASSSATIIDRPYSYTSSGAPIALGENFYTNTGSMAITFELSGATFNDIVETGGTFFTLSLTPDNNASAKTISVAYGNGSFAIVGMGLAMPNAYVPYIPDEVPLVFQYNSETKIFSFSYYHEYNSITNPYDLTEVIATWTMAANNPFESENFSAGALTISLPKGTATDILTWDGIVTAEDIHEYRKFSTIDIETGTQSGTSLTEVIDSSGDSGYKPGITHTIAVGGGKLNVDTDLPEGLVISTESGNEGGSVEIKQGNELSESNLAATETNKITLSGEGSYKLKNDDLNLGTGVELDNTLKDPSNPDSERYWNGTVHTGDLSADTTAADVSHLGNASSTVNLGETSNVVVDSLQAGSVGTVEVGAGTSNGLDLELKAGASEVNNLTVTGELKLGSDATLTVNGELNTQGITLNSIDSTVTAAKLGNASTSLSITLTENYMKELAGGTATVLSLFDTTGVSITLNGNVTLDDTADTQDMRSADNKYIYTFTWETPVTVFRLRAPRATSPSKVTVTGSTNPTYVQEKIGASVYSHNGRAGMGILNQAFAGLDPQTSAPGSALAGLVDTVDAGAATDKAMAAAAGASTAVLGQALSGDTDRQLRAIRNRAVSGSKDSDTLTVTIVDEKGGEVSTTQPATFSVWVNAEGNRAEQDADGTAAGYTLSSWGGTIGANMQMTPQLTLGLALTAMRGDLKSDGPDTLKGDMDTSYLSAFAHYQRGAWSHSIIGTVGDMEADYKRTVNHAKGCYSTTGDTNGTAFGLMYELSRKYALTSKSSISPVFNIAYRHTKVDSYNERNSNAALSVNDQSLDTLTMGLGARYAALVGGQTINRTCAFEARALVKCDLGDRQSDTMVGFVGQAARSNIESAELGTFALELGTGISIPVGSGSIFADGAVELRSEYTNINATVGYKIQF